MPGSLTSVLGFNLPGRIGRVPPDLTTGAVGLRAGCAGAAGDGAGSARVDGDAAGAVRVDAVGAGAVRVEGEGAGAARLDVAAAGRLSVGTSTGLPHCLHANFLPAYWSAML